jgi:hypothetical protein
VIAFQDSFHGTLKGKCCDMTSEAQNHETVIDFHCEITGRSSMVMHRYRQLCFLLVDPKAI